MVWDAPLFLGGPVLSWELVRAQRLKRLWIPLAVWLVCVAAAAFALAGELSAKQRYVDVDGKPVPPIIAMSLDAQRRLHVSAEHASWQLRLLMAGLTVALPALVGVRLGQDKERGILMALLCTDLNAGNILIGKLLGCPALPVRFALLALPLVGVAAGYADVPPVRLAAPLALAFVFGFFLAGAALLIAVAARHSYEAALGSYALLALGVTALVLLAREFLIPRWLDPLGAFTRISDLNAPLDPQLFLTCALFWSALGLCFLAVAVRLLRPYSCRQTESPKERLGPWRWRPAVANDAICWRELHILGVAPFSPLRRVPKPVALAAIFALACGFFALEAPAVMEEGGGRSFAERREARAMIDVFILGLVMIFMAAATVSIRCRSSIVDEQRRRTWDDLLATPLDVKEIVVSKRRGVTLAALPYVFVVGLPMIVLGYWAGPAGVPMAIALAAAAAAAIYVAACTVMETALHGEREEWAKQLNPAVMPAAIRRLRSKRRMLATRWDQPSGKPPPRDADGSFDIADPWA